MNFPAEEVCLEAQCLLRPRTDVSQGDETQGSGQRTGGYGQSTGGGLATSDNVRNLSSGGGGYGDDTGNSGLSSLC
jgi:hypothetical protein